jgi:transposase
MRFYTEHHQFYCGIDLHARQMYVCVLDEAGKIVLHRNMPAGPEQLARAIEPYVGHDLVIAVECVFTWYWIGDFCAERGIPFVLAHALYIKAIHGAKTKNDKIDSRKIAMLLRAGVLPQAYPYPVDMRSTRDLLRRRDHAPALRASRSHREHQHPVQLPALREIDRASIQPQRHRRAFRR